LNFLEAEVVKLLGGALKVAKRIDRKEPVQDLPQPDPKKKNFLVRHFNFFNAAVLYLIFRCTSVFCHPLHSIGNLFPLVFHLVICPFAGCCPFVVIANILWF